MVSHRVCVNIGRVIAQFDKFVYTFRTLFARYMGILRLKCMCSPRKTPEMNVSRPVDRSSTQKLCQTPSELRDRAI